jgi:MFS family permease
VNSRSRWIPVWFLFAGGLINYMDRSAISVAAPLLMKDMHLNPARLGIVFSSFFAGYALFTFIGGYASDVLGPKRVFVLAMTVWSTFCGLTAAAVGFLSLLVVRVGFGFGEGPFGAAANKMSGAWFPRRKVATAIGLANAGTPIGGALAGPVAGWIELRYGWRTSFVVLAAIGFLWTILWVLFVPDRPKAPDLQRDTAGAEVQTDLGVDHRSLREFPLSSYLRSPVIIATGLSFFGYSYILYFFLSWFPSYLTMSRHLKIPDMALVNTIPWILGTVGLVMSGLVCDFLAEVMGDVLRARKLVLVVCSIAAASCVTLAGLVPDLFSVVACMAASIFFLYLTGATYWAIIQETVHPKHVGAVGGYVHLIANCAGVVGPAATGLIVQATGSFTSTFVLAGGIGLSGALLVAIFVKDSAGLSTM